MLLMLEDGQPSTRPIGIPNPTMGVAQNPAWLQTPVYSFFVTYCLLVCYSFHFRTKSQSQIACLQLH